MNLCTYLPSGYKSWFALYQEAKQHFRPDRDYVEWFEHGPVFISRTPVPTAVKVEPICYSIRYLEQQVLAELIELRQIETFNKKELEILYYGMQSLTAYQSGDVDIDAVYKKVRTLLTDERKKLRRG